MPFLFFLYHLSNANISHSIIVRSSVDADHNIQIFGDFH